MNGRDPLAAGRRAEPARDLGPQARRPGRGPRAVPLDRDARSPGSGSTSTCPGWRRGWTGWRWSGRSITTRPRSTRRATSCSRPAGSAGSGEEHPHFGSVVARLKGPTAGLPPFVVLPGPIGNTGVGHPARPVGRTAGAGVRARSSCRSTATRSTRRSPRVRPREPTTSATPTAGPRSARAACWPGGWSRRGCAWSRSTCSRRSSTRSPGTATARRRSARSTTTPRAAADVRPRLLGPARRPGASRPSRLDAGRGHRRVRPDAADQPRRRPRPLAGRLERRAGRRRRPRRPGHRRQRRPRRRARRPARHARPSCWRRSTTASASTTGPISTAGRRPLPLVEDGRADPRAVRLIPAGWEGMQPRKSRSYTKTAPRQGPSPGLAFSCLSCVSWLTPSATSGLRFTGPRAFRGLAGL